MLHSRNHLCGPLLDSPTAPSLLPTTTGKHERERREIMMPEKLLWQIQHGHITHKRWSHLWIYSYSSSACQTTAPDDHIFCVNQTIYWKAILNTAYKNFQYFHVPIPLKSGSLSALSQMISASEREKDFNKYILEISKWLK